MAPRYRIVTKHRASAWDEPEFRAEIDGLPADIGRVLVCGATATSCVRRTALDLAYQWASGRPGRRVVVTALLAMARKSAYCTPPRSPSRFRTALAEMRVAGAELSLGPAGWF